jgi:hypothetical protein
MAYDIVSLVPAFCQSFVEGLPFAEGGIAFSEQIDRPRMDYSLDSLHPLDRYLEVAHRRSGEIAEQDWTNTVLAAGCYLGEVIRRNSELGFRWVNYHDHFPKYPQMMAIFPEGLGTCAVLVAGSHVTLPINKIGRFIAEGPENSTHVYALGEMKPRQRS